MSMDPSRRSLLKRSGAVLGASVLTSQLPGASRASQHAESSPRQVVRLSFNENPYGPSPEVADAIQREFNRLSRYCGQSSSATSH